MFHLGYLKVLIYQQWVIKDLSYAFDFGQSIEMQVLTLFSKLTIQVENTNYEIIKEEYCLPGGLFSRFVPKGFLMSYKLNILQNEE